MNLKNDYVVIYKEIAEAVKAGQYKFIYEKAGHIYGSKVNVPTENDYCFTKANTVSEPKVEEPETKLDTPVSFVEEPAQVNEATVEVSVSDVPTKQRGRRAAPKVSTAEERPECEVIE